MIKRIIKDTDKNLLLTKNEIKEIIDSFSASDWNQVISNIKLYSKFAANSIINYKSYKLIFNIKLSDQRCGNINSKNYNKYISINEVKYIPYEEYKYKNSPRGFINDASVFELSISINKDNINKYISSFYKIDANVYGINVNENDKNINDIINDINANSLSSNNYYYIHSLDRHYIQPTQSNIPNDIANMIVNKMVNISISSEEIMKDILKLLTDGRNWRASLHPQYWKIDQISDDKFKVYVPEYEIKDLKNIIKIDESLQEEINNTYKQYYKIISGGY